MWPANTWKVTPFCKMFNCPLPTLGCNTEGLPFPTGIMGRFGLSALNHFRGSNNGLHPKKHTEMYAIYLLENIHSVTRIQAVKPEVCAVTVTMRKTQGRVEVVTWAGVTITSTEEGKTKPGILPASSTHLLEQHAYNVFQLGFQVYPSAAAERQSIHQLADTLCV